jgi:hypothetical protein
VVTLCVCVVSPPIVVSTEATVLVLSVKREVRELAILSRESYSTE